MLEIYTDGSSIGNPGPGGWGVIIPNPPAFGIPPSQGGLSVSLSGSHTHTTNNVMELTAVIKAMERCIEQSGGILPQASSGLGLFGSGTSQKDGGGTIDESIIIYTDSTYVQKGVTERLATRVRRDRRKSKGGQLVSNVALWQRLHSLLPAFTNLQRQRVKAHAGNKRNEKVDDLARGEAEKMIKR